MSQRYGPAFGKARSFIGALSAENWTPDEAVLLLAGHDEDFIELIDRPGPHTRFLPLPSRATEELDSYAQAALELALLEKLVAGHPSMSPRAWIELALRNGFQPPWLVYLQDHPEFSDWVRARRDNSLGSDTAENVTDVSHDNHQARGGKERWRQGMSFLVEQEIRKCFADWKFNPRLYSGEHQFLQEMSSKYISPTAPLDPKDLELGQAPAVRTRRTINKIVTQLCKAGAPPKS